MENNVNYEAALVWAIITRQDMKTVKKQKIDNSFFFGTVEKAAMIFLEGYYDNPNYTDTPSVPTFLARYPKFPQINLEESVIALCDHVRVESEYTDVAVLCNEVSELAAIDPHRARQRIGEWHSQMSVRYNVDSSCTVASCIDEILQDYLIREANPTELQGYSLLFPALNKATRGGQKGHMAAWYARPKRGKTHALVAICNTLSSQHGKGILFSQELPRKEMVQRVVAEGTGINFSRFLRGRLKPQERKDFFEDIHVFEEKPPFIMDRLVEVEEKAVTEIKARVQEHGLDWVAIDGANGLFDDHKALVRFTKALKKQVCLDENVFLLMTSHANRGAGASAGQKGTGSDMSYGDGFFAHCDWAVFMDRDVEDLQERKWRANVAFIRNGICTAWRANFRLYEDMTQTEELPFGEMSEDEREEAEEAAAANDAIVAEVSKQFTDTTIENHPEDQPVLVKPKPKLRVKRG